MKENVFLLGKMNVSLLIIFFTSRLAHAPPPISLEKTRLAAEFTRSSAQGEVQAFFVFFELCIDR
ncbi:hypothetical protein NP83_07520 [Neobacillus niacini]|nr:hypothetical protein NP83_07520 [Neobacillus niacini]